MKILKIFGIVVGIHVFALVLIFANPGCSSSTKQPPAKADTVTSTEPAAAAVTPAPMITPAPAPADSANAANTGGVTFSPDASRATPSGDSRYMPTRPGTPVAGALTSEPVGDVTPVTTYTVKSGDNLSTIAKKNHTTIAELAAANQLSTKAMLHPGQKLKIPTGKAATPAPAATNGAQAKTPETTAPAAATSAPRGAKELRHVVKSGETLGGIARVYGVKSSDIAAANHIADPTKIRPGMELLIPGWESPAGKNGKAAVKSGTGTLDSRSPTADQQPTTTEPAIGNQPPPVPVIRVEDTPVAPPPRP